MSFEDRLRDAGPAPGESAARRRAWALAHAAVPATTRSRRRAWRPVLAVAVAVVVAAIALTPPGAAVADWVAARVRDAVGERAATPAREDRLPGGGTLLTSSPAGPVVIGAGAPKRLLGDVGEATWSPHARFVAATRGIELIAVDRRGHRHWSLSQPTPIRHPRWSPSGFRVAYLTGGALRVVAGDGTGDRRIGPAGAAAPAWRPRGPQRGLHQLAYADRAGRIVLLDVDRGTVIFRTRPHHPPRQLAWSSDGERLIAVAIHRTYVFNAEGAIIRAGAVPSGRYNVAVAFAPRGRDYAVARGTDDARTEVVVVRAKKIRGTLPRVKPEVGYGGSEFLFAFPGPARGLAWSPDGRWVGTLSPMADAVLFLHPGAHGLAGARSLEAAAERFGDGRVVRLEGWCCRP